MTPPACAVGPICPTIAAKKDPARCDAGHPGRETGEGFRIREEASMSISTSVRRGLLVAGSFAVLTAAALPLAAQPAPAPSNPNIPPMSQGRPGFSPIDQTKVEA